ncbi:MAG: pyridoxine 5'-phosphate synthase [Spirochaetes bacterium]|nr:pyridoxine 5'-phosphate synthase [Spirochaetota bacterium]
MKLLGVNIDHIATLRNARGEFFPPLSHAASIVEQAGGDFITIHLREDRRHINDDDLAHLSQTVTTYLNLEMACNEDVLKRAIEHKPFKATLVPERREEVTTEGGLDVVNHFDKIKEYVTALKENNIFVSLFIEPDIKGIDKFMETGADDIEIHTGGYSLATPQQKPVVLKRISEFAQNAQKKGLKICAGHGLTYHNISPICQIKEIEEFNIGYSIIVRSIFSGLKNAVSDMKRLIKEAN